MHLGIFAKTFVRPTLEETLDTVAYHGLTHIQFNMSCVGLPTLPDRIDEDLCRAIARSHRERGLTIAAVSGTFNLCDPNITRLEDNLRRFGVLAASCRWLDTRIITLCTGTRDIDDMWKHHPDNLRRRTWQTLLQSVGEAVKIADRYELTLAVEPEIHNVVSSAMRARKLLDEIDSPLLRVVIDPTNLFRPGEVRPLCELLCEAFDWLGQDFVLAHAKPPDFGEHPGSTAWLSEFLGDRYKEMHEDTRRTLAYLRRGTTNFEHCLAVQEQSNRLSSFFRAYAAALHESGYGGPVIMHGLPEIDVGDVASLLRRELKIPEHNEPGK